MLANRSIHAAQSFQSCVSHSVRQLTGSAMPFGFCFVCESEITAHSSTFGDGASRPDRAAWGRRGRIIPRR